MADVATGEKIVDASPADVHVASLDADPVAQVTVAAAPMAERDARSRPQEPVRQQIALPLTELMFPDLPLPPPLLETQKVFAAESVDPQWASAAEAHILSEIAALPGRSMVTLQVECRSTVCRLQVVEVERDSGAADPNALNENGTPPGVSAAVNSVRDLTTRFGLEPRGAISVPDGSGTRVLLAYFGRQFASASTGR